MNESLGSNPILSVNGISVERLRYAMKLAQGFPAHGYKIDSERGQLVFMRYASSPDMVPFPTPLNAERCADVAFDWLSAQTYPRQPDHDGDNDKGWLLSTGAWGQVDGHGYHSFMSVKPCWIMFGK